MLYREIIAVSSQIHTKHINTLCGQNVEFVNVKPGGTYSYHWALKGHIRVDGILQIILCRNARRILTFRRQTFSSSKLYIQHTSVLVQFPAYKEGGDQISRKITRRSFHSRVERRA